MSIEGKVEYHEKSDAFEFWGQGPPPPPDEEIIANDLSCQGTIALALREALLELQSEQDSETAVLSPRRSDNEATEEPGHRTATGRSDIGARPPLLLSPKVINRIMQSLGKEIAKTQHRRSVDGTSGSTPLPLEHGRPEPPAALLRGRVEYYNRRNNKWRFVVREAELAERPMLDKYRRKRERPSLWLVSEEQNTKRSNKFDLEVLVFDDIE